MYLDVLLSYADVICMDACYSLPPVLGPSSEPLGKALQEAVTRHDVTGLVRAFDDHALWETVCKTCIVFMTRITRKPMPYDAYQKIYCKYVGVFTSSNEYRRTR